MEVGDGATSVSSFTGPREVDEEEALRPKPTTPDDWASPPSFSRFTALGTFSSSFTTFFRSDDVIRSRSAPLSDFTLACFPSSVVSFPPICCAGPPSGPHSSCSPSILLHLAASSLTSGALLFIMRSTSLLTKSACLSWSLISPSPLLPPRLQRADARGDSRGRYFLCSSSPSKHSGVSFIILVRTTNIAIKLLLACFTNESSTS
mmetsp:Transcript_23544/g.49006  ORF Transcript_23544/g.49006 Transcript_23544/m.49006 type:complete len:205 (-) Transcript_23544:544-1158(-)